MDTEYLIVLLPLFLVGVGLVRLLLPDTAWSMQERSNSRKGVVSERTDSWERSNRLAGFFAIAFGGALLLFVLFTF
jgi:hypothetical protein